MGDQTVGFKQECKKYYTKGLNESISSPSNPYQQPEDSMDINGLNELRALIKRYSVNALERAIIQIEHENLQHPEPTCGCRSCEALRRQSRTEDHQ